MRTFENLKLCANADADADRRRRQRLGDNISSPGTSSQQAKNIFLLFT